MVNSVLMIWTQIKFHFPGQISVDSTAGLGAESQDMEKSKMELVQQKMKLYLTSASKGHVRYFSIW